MEHLIEVEKGKESFNGHPSVGPTYRSIFAKDGFPPPVPGLQCCWDIFRMAVENYPENRMLGRCEIIDGKAGKYVWLTYKEAYGIVIKLITSIQSYRVQKGGRCGIFGINCPEWTMGIEDT